MSGTGGKSPPQSLGRLLQLRKEHRKKAVKGGGGNLTKKAESRLEKFGDRAWCGEKGPRAGRRVGKVLPQKKVERVKYQTRRESISGGGRRKKKNL